jgi:hypothetical protein
MMQSHHLSDQLTNLACFLSNYGWLLVGDGDGEGEGVLETQGKCSPKYCDPTRLPRTPYIEMK